MRDGISRNAILQLVIRSSLGNAERFLDDAVLLANNFSFGHAFAFAILALEETGKAIYWNWAKNSFVNVDDDFFKNLRTHRTKQRVVKEIKKLAVLKTEIDNYRKNRNRCKIPFESLPELDSFLNKLEESSRFKSVDAFYGELEKMKHLALYVDVDENGIPSDPSIFTKDICDKYLRFVQTIFRYAKDGLLSETESKD